MEQIELNRKVFYNSWSFVIILCLALGLAPITQEPHIWGKLRWVAGGAVGMKLIDWGDLVMHGIPWVLLVRLAFLEIKRKYTPSKS